MHKVTHVFHDEQATREGLILRASICGPTGCGKTKTGLIIATRMVEKMNLGPVFVIDSENRSALRYAYSPRTKRGYKFRHVEMPADDYSPQAYMRALDYCEDKGAGVILVDSLSHAWIGINGALQQVDDTGGKSKFSDGWKAVTPVYNQLIQRLQDTGSHILWTLRAKMAYEVVENDRGKKEPKKIGLAPVMRDGIEFEGDISFDMSVPDNDLTVGKTRCDLLVPGEVFKKPGNDLADLLVSWLEDAEAPKEARSFGEALNFFVASGICAAEEKNVTGWKRAEAEFSRWCQSHGVAEQRFLDGVRDASRRVKEATAPAVPPKDAAPALPPSDPAPAKPASSPASPVDADEERRRRIDLGME